MEIVSKILSSFLKADTLKHIYNRDEWSDAFLNSELAWFSTKFITAKNGPKFAKLISDIKNECPGTDKNQTWDNKNSSLSL
jgi:hypothetical protein